MIGNSLILWHAEGSQPVDHALRTVLAATEGHTFLSTSLRALEWLAHIGAHRYTIPASGDIIGVGKIDIRIFLVVVATGFATVVGGEIGLVVVL